MHGGKPAGALRPEFDWNLLRTFVVVVEEGSITAAANRLLLQQPAVSMALKRLEQSVGHRLIDRRPGRFEVTEAGEKLHRQARDIFAAVVRLPDALETAGSDISGHVSVHAVSQVHHPEWDSRLTLFFEMFPKVTLSITIETTADVISAVERGIASIGLCDGIIPPGLGKALYKRERYGLDRVHIGFLVSAMRCSTICEATIMWPSRQMSSAAST